MKKNLIIILGAVSVVVAVISIPIYLSMQKQKNEFADIDKRMVEDEKKQLNLEIKTASSKDYMEIKNVDNFNFQTCVFIINPTSSDKIIYETNRTTSEADAKAGDISVKTGGVYKLKDSFPKDDSFQIKWDEKIKVMTATCYSDEYVNTGQKIPIFAYFSYTADSMCEGGGCSMKFNENTSSFSNF